MDGWETKTLGEVCQMIQRGVSPKYLEDKGICVLNQKCIRDHLVNYQLARRHDDQAKPVNAERYIQVGDVLVNSTGTGTLGRVAQVRENPPEPTTVDSHVTIVRPLPEKFFNDFFGYMLIKIEDEIASSGEGASGQTELARATLQKKFQVSYPHSKDEQKRIVAILDEAVAAIGQARANAVRNKANARELFDSYLEAVFSNPSPDWQENLLENVTNLITCGVAARPEYVEEGIPFLSAKNVKNGTIIWEGFKYVSKETHHKLTKHNKPEVGDLLYSRIGACLGDAAVLEEAIDFSIFVSLTLIKPKLCLDSYFLKYYLNASAPECRVVAMIG